MAGDANMADEPDRELVDILAGQKKPTLAELLQGQAATWWNGLGDNMRAQAAKPQDQLLREFALQALMQAPMGLGSRGGAARGADYATAAKIENRLLANPEAWRDPGITGGAIRIGPGETVPSVRSSTGMVEGWPEIVAKPFPAGRAARPANEPYPFTVLPGGRR